VFFPIHNVKQRSTIFMLRNIAEQLLRHPEVLADEVGEPRRTTAPGASAGILRGSLRSHLRMTGNKPKSYRSRDAIRTRVIVTRREFLRPPHRSSPENTGGGHRHLTICASSHEM
jgi:hypothetical protein